MRYPSIQSPVTRRGLCRVPCAAALAALLTTCLPNSVSGEVQDFSILLPPTPVYVHYADGYLRGDHSTIDLTDLTFEDFQEWEITDDDDNPEGDDDGGEDDMYGDVTDDWDPPRKLYLSDNRRMSNRYRSMSSSMESSRELDGGVDLNGESFIDIVAFLLPSKCANSRNGCDWTELGVGAMVTGGDEEADLRWCCTNDEIELGLCSEYGRLIINEDKFTGERRYVRIPSQGPVKKKLQQDVFSFDTTGRYDVVFANCNDRGRPIVVNGQAVWESSHGYLPGELFPFMYFYTILLAIYVALFLWYSCLMRVNKESRIPIEKWILITILMGLLELAFRTADYWAWNGDGNRHPVLSYTGILMGVMKHGFSRCLVVMVSMGWGVVRDTLGRALFRIVLLGAIYVALSAVRDFMILFAVEDMQTLSYDEEVELFDVATILTFVIAAVDVVFIMWILDALNGTMTYLENMNQTRKYDRFLKLRTIFLFSILFAVVWAVFNLVNSYDEDGIVREEHEWIVAAATEVNYLFVLIGVAFLWRPNPSAKEYAYVMELSAGDDGENGMELSGVVPSAMDDDEEPTQDGNGYSNGHSQDSRFKIDDTEMS